mmetsp:Transcript_27951/g.41174  ORF Transcript_27951/g.41174 Transcript_27951/m.41174 type:complete len:111 (-) Transcript_27951:130-462(-)
MSFTMRASAAALRPSVQAMSTMAQPATSTSFKAILEDYRQKHYSYETKSRFRREVVKACSPVGSSIPTEHLHQFLNNIGHKIPQDDLHHMLKEEGVEKADLPVQTMMKWM